jgi:hypothetical protein
MVAERQVATERTLLVQEVFFSGADVRKNARNRSALLFAQSRRPITRKGYTYVLFPAGFMPSLGDFMRIFIKLTLWCIL